MDALIRVLLVEDERIVREAIRVLLELEEKITLVGEAETGAGAIQKALSLQPDVILLDLRLPDRSGIEVIREIIKRQPEARILVLTGYASDEDAVEILRAGAMDIVQKTAAITDLIHAIHAAYGGQALLRSANTRKFLRQWQQPPELPSAILSAAEIRVVVYLTCGFTNQDISTKTGDSPATVRTQVSRIMHKLRLTNRTQIALYALKQGLVDLDSSWERSSRALHGRNGAIPTPER